MKLYQITNLILLIIILFSGYFFPYVAPHAGQPVRRFTASVKNGEILKTETRKQRTICYGHDGVFGCDPSKGELP
ncbi:hypothetical protein LguiB_013538 [Lonicera macranthoides]